MELSLAAQLDFRSTLAVDRVSGLPVIDTAAGDRAAVARYHDLVPYTTPQP